MILIIGGTGNVGKHVLPLLQETKLPIRLGCYDVDETKSKVDDASIDYVDFDFYKPETYPKALEDITSVFFIRPPQIGNPKDIYPFIDLLKEQQIEHTIFLSLMGVEKNPIPPHGKIEKYIKKLHLPYTFIRPGFFMENLVYPHGKDIRDLDQLIVPAGKSRTNFIAAKDIGEVIARCLVEKEPHINKAYTLTGDYAYNYYEVADLLSNVLNRQINYTKPGLLQYRKHMIKQGFDKAYINVTVFLYIMTRLGTAKDQTNTVKTILNRKPTSLKDFIEHHKKNFIKEPSPSR